MYTHSRWPRCLQAIKWHTKPALLLSISTKTSPERPLPTTTTHYTHTGCLNELQYGQSVFSEPLKTLHRVSLWGWFVGQPLLLVRVGGVLWWEGAGLGRVTVVMYRVKSLASFTLFYFYPQSPSFLSKWVSEGGSFQINTFLPCLLVPALLTCLYPVPDIYINQPTTSTHSPSVDILRSANHRPFLAKFSFLFLRPLHFTPKLIIYYYWHYNLMYRHFLNCQTKFR